MLHLEAKQIMKQLLASQEGLYSMELVNLLSVISWNSITEVHKEVSIGVQERYEKKTVYRKYLLHRRISQLSSTKDFFLIIHLVCFNMSTTRCSTHIKMIFELMPHVHKNNLGHCCSRLCYALSQSLKVGSFLLTDDILHITSELHWC
jgi:hypothetical protein